jgi:hypothetical protein
MKKLRRFDIPKLLADPDLRRRMIVRSTVATQAREGIDITEAEAENSYYVVTEGERAAFLGLVPFRTETGENDGRHVEFVKNLAEFRPEVRADVPHRDFGVIDSSPLAFDRLALIGSLFREHAKLDPSFASAAQGLATADDSRFVRCWWEIVDRNYWVNFAKGGDFSRFYSDVYLVVLWINDGEAIRHFDKAYIRNENYYQKPGLTWPRRTQRGFSVRMLPEGSIFGDKGPAIFPTEASDNYFLLGILNSRLAELLLKALISFGSWEVGAVKRIPVPRGPGEGQNEIACIAQRSHDTKATWDTGNEICTRCDRPWVLQPTRTNNATTLSAALGTVLEVEADLDAELQSTYTQLNDAVYRLYGVNDKLREKLEAAIGKRPPETVWPQMEGKDRDQKRREHVDRLLCYLIKRIVEADEDGLVCFESVAHEAPLLERLRKELSACFPQQDPSTLETEVVNELKKKTKGYRRAETLTEWLQDAFFDTHSSLYQQRPLIWHLASNQVRRVPAIGVLVHAHKFNADALAKLRGTHLRDRLATLRREAGQASQDSREDDRLEALAAIEELEAYDAKLKNLQDSHHTGPDNGDRDYRILTPWKSEAGHPKGWNPDLDDGIKVNIAPLARTNILRRKMRFAEAEKED